MAETDRHEREGSWWRGAWGPAVQDGCGKWCRGVWGPAARDGCGKWCRMGRRRCTGQQGGEIRGRLIADPPGDLGNGGRFKATGGGAILEAGVPSR